MWPSGEVEVCKTFYEGSNPSMTSHGKQSLRLLFLQGAFLMSPYLFFKGV